MRKRLNKFIVANVFRLLMMMLALVLGSGMKTAFENGNADGFVGLIIGLVLLAMFWIMVEAEDWIEFWISKLESE